MYYIIISIDKIILLNLSAETIIYISSKFLVHLGNAFRKCLLKGTTQKEGLIEF